MGNKHDIQKYGGHKPSLSAMGVDSVSQRTYIDQQDGYSFIHGISMPSPSLVAIPQNSDISVDMMLPIKSILIRKQQQPQTIMKSLNDENIKSKLTSIEIAQLIIYGYCHEMEINDNLEYLIPITIIELCFEFYYVSKIIYCLTEGNDIRGANLNGLFVSDIDNDTNWKLNVYDIKSIENDENTNNNNSNYKDTTQNDYKWSIDCSAMCFTSNIKSYLPLNIFENIEALYGHNDNHSKYKYKHAYNAIFKCGGIKNDGLNSNYSNCIIMSDGG